jgi:hypothetical protein
MNAIVLEHGVETTSLLSLDSATLVPNAYTNAGWKSDVERLAQGAKRRGREPR